MDMPQKKAYKNRVDSLKRENKKLSEKLGALKKEKQLFQRELRTAHKLLTEIPGPVILIQGQEIVFANKMAWGLLGYSEKELLSHDLLGLVHPRSSEDARNAFLKQNAGKAIPDRFEVYMRKKNGDPLCCEVYWKKVRYHGRAALLYNVTAIDQRKHEEKKLTQSQKIQAIARMAAWLSQDFEKGFKVIKGHFARLQDIESVADQTVVRTLRRVEAGMEIGNLISQKLNCLIRLEDDQSSGTFFDTKRIVQDAVAATSPIWKDDSGGTISVKTYLRTLSPVKGHPEEMRDVFANMILNAVDAMPEGGEIYLSAEENAGFAWIYIQDSGTGIPDEIKEKIFDPFFTTRGSTHAGLGLSLAYAIIRRHGGDIDLISQEGQGATFIVKLPLSEQPVADEIAGRMKNRIRDSQILMVSDGSIAEELLVQEFVTKGGRVTVTSSCMEGLKLLRRKIYNLVIAGVDVPDFNPSGFVSHIKKLKQDLPLVLFNSGENGRTFHSLEKFGADLIIQRPLEMDRVMSVISETMTTKAASE